MGQWSPTTPWFGPDKQTEKVWPRYLCRNPNCKSVGKSHPSCHCGAPSFSQQAKNLEHDAHGGAVGSHFCSERTPHSDECEHFASGGDVQENHEFFNDPDVSLDHSIVNHGAHHLLTKTGHTRSEEPGRVMHDHLTHVKQGNRGLKNHSKNILETKKEHLIHSDPEKVQALKAHLEDLQANPQKLLDVGGSMGDDLPNHAGLLGAKVASMMNHLDVIKPKIQQPNAMNEPIKPSKMDEAKYNRQLAVMQNPVIVYQGIKDGMLHPDDLQTIQSVYPKLFEKMQNGAMEAIIDAKAQGRAIPYKHRIGLGLLLGQPLDYTQSPAAAQAIIKANGVQQPQSQGKSSKSSTSAAVLKQMNKVDDMFATPTEKSQLDNKA